MAALIRYGLEHHLDQDDSAFGAFDPAMKAGTEDS
jgi:hypothetical protein